jgi:hypothetical protein
MKCKNCEGELRRRSRDTMTAFWMSCLCVYPYRCRRCKRNSSHLNLEQASLFYTVVILGFSLFATGAFWYRAHHKATARVPAAVAEAQVTMQVPAATVNLDGVLSNQDVVDLTKAKLGPDVLIQMIRTSPHNFQVDPRSVIQLKQSGTDDQVISAMIEATPPAPKNGNPILAKLMVR